MSEMKDLQEKIHSFWEYAAQAHDIAPYPYRYNLGLCYKKIVDFLQDKELKTSNQTQQLKEKAS